MLEIERGQLADIRPLRWQAETSLSNRSWAYLEHETFKTPEFVIHQLRDIVSKNGNSLLHIGPRPDGTIPDQVQQTLRDIGAWFQTNTEAIYRTHPWTVYGEGPTKLVGGAFQENATQPFTAQDIRFTAKGNTLYALALGWPRDDHLTIHSLGANSKLKVRDASLRGSDDRTQWSQGANGLELVLPAQAPGANAYSFRSLPTSMERPFRRGVRQSCPSFPQA